MKPNAHLHLPLREHIDIQKHLTNPGHWKPGYSTHALCTTWTMTKGFPAAIRAVLARHPECGQLELVDGFFERCVDLGDGSTPSKTDLMAICADPSGLMAMAVEGKVKESFGKPVKDWLNGSPTRKKRLQGLCATLGMAVEAAGPLRYQLFHRTASAIYEARCYRASRAMILVHSFCPRETGFADFASFTNAMGFTGAARNSVVGPKEVGGIELMMTWISDRLPDEALSEGSALQ